MTYDKGYADGYNDGFRAGLEAGKGLKSPSNPIWPDIDNKPRCRVCGMDFSKPMGYVCFNDKCPSKVTCSWTGETV